MATTPNLKIPYPVGTDRVADGDNAMQAIAERVEARMPWGWVGYAQATADQTGIVGSATISGISVTFTAVAGRRYQATANVHLLANIAGVNTALDIVDGATGLGRWQGMLSNLSATTLVAIWSGTLTAGAHTFNVTAAFGSGTNTSKAAPGAPAFLLIEDIGPSPIPS
jgi:hypothetical protein